MKRLLSFIFALTCLTLVNAQTAILVRSGEPVSAFSGAAALTNAINVAEATGDVIVLSSGSTQWTVGTVPVVNDSYVGTDGTVIGLTGGTLGWNTEPAQPTVNLATTLVQDGDGYYQVATVADWIELKRVVETIHPAAKAKMTADIDLGDDQTMIGNHDGATRYYFSGTFDGQGHTLTVNYDKTSLAYSEVMEGNCAAPFLYINNATIRNLHVAGTITTSTKFVGGVVGDVTGTANLIERCRSSVSITSTVNADGCIGGVISHMTGGQTVTVRDCMFDGSINAPSAWGNGGIMGYKNGTGTFENCLFAPTSLNLSTNQGYCIVRNGSGTLTISNCYYTQQHGTAQGMAVSAAHLANGRTAFYLQKGRDSQVWGQQIGTDPKPVLTSEAAKHVYRSATGFTNNPAEAIDDQEVLPFVYTTDGEGNITITGFDPGFTPSAGYALVIPDELDGQPVVGIANEAFMGNKSLTSITVGRNVKTIGSWAFATSTTLTTVTLPADGALTTIGYSAFERSTALTALAIPNTVTSVGQNLLLSCSKLESLTLSNQLTEIPTNMANNCPKLGNVVIPNSVKTIRASAFRSCSSLTSIVIPNSVTTMETSVFSGCSALASATFEEGCQLTAIPAETFENTGLTSFNIPSSVTRINNTAFRYSKLTSIDFPSHVTTLGNGAFGGTSLTEVTLPATITSVGEGVFGGSSVQTANIYCSNVNTRLFSGCKQLETVNLGDGVKTIGGEAFSGCDKLTSVSIPASVTSIGSWAFYNNPALTTVTFAEGIQLPTLQDYSFCRNPKLDNFTIPASVTTLGNNVFEDCKGMTALVIPYTVTSVGQRLVSGCTMLESLTLSNQMTEIPTEMANSCTKLNNVVIPNSIKTIRVYAFRYCSSLTSIVIPKSVTTMENSVFEYCSALATVTFEEGCQLTTIPNYTFYQSGLQRITIPASVRTIGSSAFRYCASLNNVTIPSTVLEIQAYAFANNTAMTNITLEEGLCVLGTDVFRDGALRSIVLPSTLGVIGVNLFYNDTQLETLDLSKCVNVYELYNYTALRGSSTITNGVPTTCKIIMPPYAQATLGANDEVKQVDFNLTQDAEGCYNIGTREDFYKFAAFTRKADNAAANARLTADIDLTGEEIKLGVVATNGTSNYTYKGIFDGQGHTLTINYTNNMSRTGGVFTAVENATIKRLKVDGNINVAYIGVGGFIGSAFGTLTMEDCESAVKMTGLPVTTATERNMGGFINMGNSAKITFTDCLFSGSFLGGSLQTQNGAYVAWMESAGRITYTNCLNIGTFDVQASTCYPLGRTPNVNNISTATRCYYCAEGVNATGNVGSKDLVIAVTAEQLADGSVTELLQNGREENVWMQDEENGKPSLHIFYAPIYTGEFAYTVEENGEITITGFRDGFAVPDNYDLVIPDEIEGKPVTTLYSYAFGYEEEIKYGNTDYKKIATASIGKNVKTIGDEAFYHCSNLTTVTFPDDSQLRTFGAFSFTNTGITSITIPTSVNEMVSTVFHNCTALTTVTFKGDVPATFSGAFPPFVGCTALESIFVPLEYLANYATNPGLNAVNEWRDNSITSKLFYKADYTVPASGLGTFSTGVAVTMPEGLEAYYCKNYDAENGAIGVTRIRDAVPATTGVLLRGEGGETFTISASDETPAAISDNALVAVTTLTNISQTETIDDVEYTNFGLSGGVFKKVNANGGTVKANRAYLHIPTSALTSETAARGISLVWDEDVTRVYDVRSNTDNESGEFYNLNGQRVNHPTKGLYIVNGKKVFIK